MKGEDSLYPPDWIKVARKDWRRIGVMLNEDDVEAAGYFLQQSLEKYLKAFLLQKGWRLKKIHELDALLDDAIKYNPELTSFYSLCEKVSGYYFTERYPSLTEEGLTCDEIKVDIKEAEEFIQAMFGEELDTFRNCLSV
ncbi:MAG: HEPN domain-containing protein [bacterium]|nr:HEPN domain-containing protein [bacterium]